MQRVPRGERALARQFVVRGQMLRIGLGAHGQRLGQRAVVRAPRVLRQAFGHRLANAVVIALDAAGLSRAAAERRVAQTVHRGARAVAGCRAPAPRARAAIGRAATASTSSKRALARRQARDARAQRRGQRRARIERSLAPGRAAPARRARTGCRRLRARARPRPAPRSAAPARARRHRASGPSARLTHVEPHVGRQRLVERRKLGCARRVVAAVRADEQQRAARSAGARDAASSAVESASFHCRSSMQITSGGGRRCARAARRARGTRGGAAPVRRARSRSARRAITSTRASTGNRRRSAHTSRGRSCATSRSRQAHQVARRARRSTASKPLYGTTLALVAAAAQHERVARRLRARRGSARRARSCRCRTRPTAARPPACRRRATPRTPRAARRSSRVAADELDARAAGMRTCAARRPTPSRRAPRRSRSAAASGRCARIAREQLRAELVEIARHGRGDALLARGASRFCFARSTSNAPPSNGSAPVSASNSITPIA